MVGKIIDVTGEDDPDAPTIIKITPGVNPYSQLDMEEEELEYKVGDETASEIHPDDDDADDLSCITIDSLKHIDNKKVKNIWQGMAKLKRQEGDYYGELADMVDEMSPETIYQSVQVTPRPATALPQCAEDLLTKLGSEELFRRILAVGYMSYQAFEKESQEKIRRVVQTKHYQRSCSQVQHFNIEADGFASGCCHKQRRYTEGEDAKS